MSIFLVEFVIKQIHPVYVIVNYYISYKQWRTYVLIVWRRLDINLDP